MSEILSKVSNIVSSLNEFSSRCRQTSSLSLVTRQTIGIQDYERECTSLYKELARLLDKKISLDELPSVLKAADRRLDGKVSVTVFERGKVLRQSIQPHPFRRSINPPPFPPSKLSGFLLSSVSNTLDVCFALIEVRAVGSEGWPERIHNIHVVPMMELYPSLSSYDMRSFNRAIRRND